MDNEDIQRESSWRFNFKTFLCVNFNIIPYTPITYSIQITEKKGTIQSWCIFEKYTPDFREMVFEDELTILTT